jgi:flagellar protein FlaG
MIIQPINIRTQDSNAQSNYEQMQMQRKDAGDKDAMANLNVSSASSDDASEQITAVIEQQKEKPENTAEKEEELNISKAINDIVSNISNVYFKFEFDEDLNPRELILKIIDEETKEVVSQYPSELSLKIAQFLEQTLGTGQLTDATI